MDYNKFDKIEHSDSDESIDQMEQIRNANIKPGMFVSGWEDPNDEVYPETDPHGLYTNTKYLLLMVKTRLFHCFKINFRFTAKRDTLGGR